MEALAPENLRMWLMTVMLKYRKGRDRDTGMVEEDGAPILKNKYSAVTGDELVLTAAFPIYSLAKNLIGKSGERASIHGGKSDLTEEELELLHAVKDRLAREVYRMNQEEPGLWVINPEVEGVHLGVLKGHSPDPDKGAPISAIRPTLSLLMKAEKEVKGTKWERFLGERGVYEDIQVGGGS